MQIAIITAEASGDRVGGQLARELRLLRPDASIWGTGGRFLREAGAEVFVDSSRYGAIGAAASLKMLPRLLGARKRLMRELARRPPDVLVPVDAGGFNLGFGPIEGLCPWARRELPRTKILYYFPPGSWRRTLRATTLGAAADAVATPFPWSETELRRLGVNAYFVGHPLLDLVKTSEPVAEFAARYGLDRDRPVVGILPGSRPQEIAEILPVQLEAAAVVHRRVPGVQFLIALAPTIDRQDVVRAVERLRERGGGAPGGELLGDLLHRLEERLLGGDGAGGGRQQRVRPLAVTPQGAVMPSPQPGQDPFSSRTREQLNRSAGDQRGRDIAVAIVENATYDLMAASDVLLTASGTATLEAAILGKPMVIVYRMGRDNWFEYQFIKNRMPPFIGMPNLIAGRRICPELVQDAATPEALSGEVIALLLEPERMLKMREGLREAVAQLGASGGAARVARMVVDLAETGSAGEPGTAQDGI